MINLNVSDSEGKNERVLPLRALEGKSFLSFRLEDEIFAVDVRHVREVLDYKNTTRIPGAPDFMRGIINLRGRVVPVVDMRLKFGMAATEKSVSTCIIVIEVGTGGQQTVIGALADAVQEVFEFDPGQIEPPPRLGEKGKMDFILAIGKRNDQFIIILNFNKAFSMEEVVLLGSAGEIQVEEDEMTAGLDSGKQQKEV